LFPNEPISPEWLEAVVGEAQEEVEVVSVEVAAEVEADILIHQEVEGK